MDELRASLSKNPELASLATKLSDRFSRSDTKRLLIALEKGDMRLVCKILDFSEDELNKIFKSFRDQALRLETKYPDLADFAKAMRLTGGSL